MLLLPACGLAAPEGIVAVTPLPARPTGLATPTQLPTASALQGTSTPTASPALANSALATPTSLSINLPGGEAAAIAAATDAAMQPTPRNRLTFDTHDPVPLTFEEFYDGFDLRKGLILSDKLVSLDGQPVTLEGYMAPPLKPELDYFVLTRIHLAFCSFCSTGSDWPDDIALVYVLGEPVTVTGYPVRLTGRLEVGPSVDQETGMVSLARLYADEVEVLH